MKTTRSVSMLLAPIYTCQMSEPRRAIRLRESGRLIAFDFEGFAEKYSETSGRVQAVSLRAYFFGAGLTHSSALSRFKLMPPRRPFEKIFTSFSTVRVRK